MSRFLRPKKKERRVFAYVSVQSSVGLQIRTNQGPAILFRGKLCEKILFLINQAPNMITYRRIRDPSIIRNGTEKAQNKEKRHLVSEDYQRTIFAILASLTIHAILQFRHGIFTFTLGRSQIKKHLFVYPQTFRFSRENQRI